MTLDTGTRLGRYEIRSKIGAGGMGEVYRARDLELSRDVAIKVLPSTFSTDTNRLHRFQQAINSPIEAEAPEPLTIVMNWTTLIKK